MVNRKKTRIYSISKQKNVGPKLFSAVTNRRFGKSACFLCGCRIFTKNRSDEHVIPKWLQQKFNLWNKQLVLLNGTAIPYRQLTIPCCCTCNTKHLSPIENRVRQAVDNGASAVSKLDKMDLFLWTGKIVYGLLYRELLLPLDRSSRSKKSIVSKEFLQRIQMHHYFLQGSRVNLNFVSFFPASFVVVKTQVPNEIDHQFDYRDAPGALMLSMRIGKVGIIAVLQDGGAIGSGRPPKHGRFPLHPIQFQELTAQVFYKASLMNRTPKFLITEHRNQIQVIQLPLGGLSSKPVFDDWDNHRYAQILSAFTRVPLDQLYFPPRVWTYLKTADGKPLYIDVNAVAD